MAAPDPRPGLLVARILAGMTLVGATLMVLRPFLVPVTWAAIVAYMTWPLAQLARRRTGRPRLVALLFTVGIGFLAAIPVAWLLFQLAREAGGAVESLRGWIGAGAPLPEWILQRPPLAGPAEEARQAILSQGALVGDWITRYGGRVSAGLGNAARDIARNLIALGVTLLCLYAFYLDGERIIATARRLIAALFPAAPAEIVDQIGAAVRGVVFGLLGTALAQGVLAGAAFAVAGVPAPVALGAATAVLAMVPAGPTLLGLATALWLLAMDHVGAAIGIGLWTVLVVASVDNVLRPLLISGPTRMPFLLVFLGVLGGLAWLGALGLFVGPVLLSVTFTLVTSFSHRHAPPEAAPPVAAEPEAEPTPD